MAHFATFPRQIPPSAVNLINITKKECPYQRILKHFEKSILCWMVLSLIHTIVWTTQAVSSLLPLQLLHTQFYMRSWFWKSILCRTVLSLIHSIGWTAHTVSSLIHAQ